ncbi:MAG: hypothetical protein FWH20_05950 [Oscillospiraceae bacterium]|nr:hypothetical protein [Oscillospiraceae bacterium]
MKKAMVLFLISIVIVILAVLNILWKFSTGDFSEMPFFRQINVVCSVVVIVFGGVSACGLGYAIIKAKRRK